MNVHAMLHWVWSLCSHVCRALRTWAGEEEYERYVRYCAARGQTPLDRGRYLAERLEERYRSASRCC
jgi:uncharacterized short protein YbdD (DUF466 family)